ncbi:DUF202 domain-containing protein [Corynebacterium poyangense]|uniref:DUF202 domain-containing protein n=1 Tax=Corynebacterium poyangense TaxID=2684405 RepID=A0A7H0SNV2_9CORY|nr:DUF202 domain-containing protein [Corynebacterium poyangense]MBZ8177783.1 DUF202 domain-containing protein [Corynebacterium poyangense]QNQ90227.1 DUF202 domain-containing protein [Corynebacterium poyangense]
MNQVIRHEDPGLQPERTALAWTRTTVSFCVASAMLLRWARVLGVHSFWIVALLIGVILCLNLSQRRRYLRHNHGLKTGSTQANIVGVLSLTSISLFLGLCSILLVLDS